MLHKNTTSDNPSELTPDLVKQNERANRRGNLKTAAAAPGDAIGTSAAAAAFKKTKVRLQEEQEEEEEEKKQSVKIPEDKDNSLSSSFELGEDVGADKKMNFNELIAYDAHGLPYIDIRKLIYKPRTASQKKSHKDRFQWFIPDTTFLILNSISLFSIMYHIALSFQLYAWSPNIESVLSTLKPLDGGGLLLRLKGELISPRNLSAILLLLSGCELISAVVGMYGCIYTAKYFLLLHVVSDGALLLSSLIIGLCISTLGHCDEGDLLNFHRGFENLIKSFLGETHEDDLDEKYFAQTLLDEIQLSTKCCGALDFKDYSRLSSNLHPPDLPYSCCRPWWVRDITCTKGLSHPALHLSTGTETEQRLFRGRINQIGCVPAVWNACERILFHLGEGSLWHSLLHLSLFLGKCVAIHLQLRHVKTITREIRHEDINAGRAAVGTPATSESESEPLVHQRHLGLERALVIMQQNVERIRSPLELTEDEVQFIKDRTAFNNFEMRVKYTNIGLLMETAREAVSHIPEEFPEDKLKVLHPKQLENDDAISEAEFNILKIIRTKLRAYRHGTAEETDKKALPLHPTEPQTASASRKENFSIDHLEGKKPSRKKSVSLEELYKNLEGLKRRASQLELEEDSSAPGHSPLSQRKGEDKKKKAWKLAKKKKTKVRKGVVVPRMSVPDVKFARHDKAWRN